MFATSWYLQDEKINPLAPAYFCTSVTVTFGNPDCMLLWYFWLEPGITQGVSLENVDSQYDNMKTKPHQGGAK